jgi:predicted dehydrogenase
MIRIAQIGYGYWGPNLLRNFMSLGNAQVEILIDSQKDRLTQAVSQFPTLKTSAAVEDAFNNTSVDAVVIATPVFTHYDLAKRALLAGKHVLLEKPMTATVAEAKELIPCVARLFRFNNLSPTSCKYT